MKPTKAQRQERLLALIAQRPIATQGELVAALEAEGMEITQATISRDIKELNIIKAATGAGKQRYICLSREDSLPGDRLMNVFAEAVIRMVQAQHLLVMHTLPGMAGAGASAIDAMELVEVVGTIAGDDTIFVATQDTEAAAALLLKLQRLI